MKKTILKIVLIIALLIYVLALSPLELQNDTFFDIALGREYSQNGIETIDTFSVHKNLTYHAQHLLANLTIYKLYSLFSFKGLYILEIILTCIIALLFYMVNLRFTKNRILAYILVYLEIFMFTPFISLRAQMFSTVVLLLEILLINKLLYGNNKRKQSAVIITILTLLPIALINFHSGVIAFYYIILVVYLFNLFNFKLIRIQNDEDINVKALKKLLIPFIGSLPLLMLNPFGIHAITYMFKTIGNSFINANIQEFQPFSLKGPSGLIMAGYFFIHIIILILSDKKIKYHEILFFFGTMFMTLITLRHFIFYVITTVVLIPHIENVLTKIKNWLFNGLNNQGPTIMTKTIYFITFFIISTIMISFLNNKKHEFIPETIYPVDAVEYIKENIGFDKVILNEYEWGSFLMYHNIKTFIDSRCDLYTKEYNKDVTVAEDYVNTMRCTVDYDLNVEKYNIEYFLIKKEQPLYTMLSKDKSYELIYNDDIAYIFMKK